MDEFRARLIVYGLTKLPRADYPGSFTYSDHWSVGDEQDSVSVITHDLPRNAASVLDRLPWARFTISIEYSEPRVRTEWLSFVVAHEALVALGAQGLRMAVEDTNGDRSILCFEASAWRRETGRVLRATLERVKLSRRGHLQETLLDADGELAIASGSWEASGRRVDDRPLRWLTSEEPTAT